MSLLNAKQLSRCLADGRLERAYLFFGSENYLKRHYYNQLKEQVLKGGPEEFNLTLLEGKTLSPQTLSDALQSLPVFAERKLVVVKDVELSSVKQELRAFFTETLPSLPESAVFLLYQQTVDVDEKQAKSAEIIRLFERFGAAVRFDTPGTAELLQWTGRHLAQQGKTADRDTILYFLSVTDNGMTHLKNELDKLCHYSEGSQVTRRDIDEVVSKSVDAVIFRLTDALFDRQYSDAYEVLKQLVSQRTEEVIVAGGVARELCGLYKVRAAWAEGMGAAEMAKAFGLRDFVVRKYLRTCRAFDADTLRRCLRICLDTDQSLKSENRDKTLILEAMLGELARCLGPDKGGRGA